MVWLEIELRILIKVKKSLSMIVSNLSVFFGDFRNILKVFELLLNFIDISFLNEIYAPFSFERRNY
jgi:hypothetical protein